MWMLGDDLGVPQITVCDMLFNRRLSNLGAMTVVIKHLRCCYPLADRPCNNTSGDVLRIPALIVVIGLVVAATTVRVNDCPDIT
jgi:hypothetical protein